MQAEQRVSIMRVSTQHPDITIFLNLHPDNFFLYASRTTHQHHAWQHPYIIILLNLHPENLSLYASRTTHQHHGWEHPDITLLLYIYPDILYSVRKQNNRIMRVSTQTLLILYVYTRTSLLSSQAEQPSSNMCVSIHASLVL